MNESNKSYHSAETLINIKNILKEAVVLTLKV